jgi:hypothetical protein
MTDTALAEIPALAARSPQPCPAWCEDAEAHDDQLHISDVHEVSDLLFNLHQDFGDNFAVIGISDEACQEIFLSVDEAKQAAMTLLRLVRAARKTA